MIQDTDRDHRLDRIITPEDAAMLYDAAVLVVASRRATPSDMIGPSGRAEALQRLYALGYQRGRREEAARSSDDGK